MSNSHNHVPIAVSNAVLPRAGARITTTTTTKPSSLQNLANGVEDITTIFDLFNSTSIVTTVDASPDTLVNSLGLDKRENVCIFNEQLSRIPSGDVSSCCNSTGGNHVGLSPSAQDYNFEACQYNAKKDNAKTNLLRCVLGNAGASNDTHHLCLDEDGEPDAGTALRVGLMGWLVVGLGFASVFGVTL